MALVGFTFLSWLIFKQKCSTFKSERDTFLKHSNSFYSSFSTSILFNALSSLVFFCVFENIISCVWVCVGVCGDVLLKIKMDGLPIFYFFTNTTYTSNRKKNFFYFQNFTFTGFLPVISLVSKTNLRLQNIKIGAKYC